MKRLEIRNGRIAERESADGPVVTFPNDVDMEAVRQDWHHAETVALTFPGVRDGRAFSQAARLRQLGYEGDIRATGALFQDQILFALRCGFTSFDLDDGISVEGIAQTIARYPAYYQRAAVGGPVWERRQ